MPARRMLKVLTIGFAACALIACGFLANESPSMLDPTPETSAPIAR